MAKDFILQTDMAALEQALRDVESAQAKIGVLQGTLAEVRAASEVKQKLLEDAEVRTASEVKPKLLEDPES